MKEVAGQAGYDAAVKFDDNLHEEPLDLLYQTFNCKNKILNTVVEYTVVDYARSVVSGDEYFVIQDMEGQKKQVTKQELSECPFR